MLIRHNGCTVLAITAVLQQRAKCVLQIKSRLQHRRNSGEQRSQQILPLRAGLEQGRLLLTRPQLHSLSGLPVIVIQPSGHHSTKSVTISVISVDDAIQAEIHVIVDGALVVGLAGESKEAGVYHPARLPAVVVPRDGLIAHFQREAFEDEVVVHLQQFLAPVRMLVTGVDRKSSSVSLCFAVVFLHSAIASWKNEAESERQETFCVHRTQKWYWC